MLWHSGRWRRSSVTKKYFWVRCEFRRNRYLGADYTPLLHHNGPRTDTDKAQTRTQPNNLTNTSHSLFVFRLGVDSSVTLPSSQYTWDGWIIRHWGSAVAGRVSNIWARHDRDCVARKTFSRVPHKVRCTLPLSAFEWWKVWCSVVPINSSDFVMVILFELIIASILSTSLCTPLRKGKIVL